MRSIKKITEAIGVWLILLACRVSKMFEADDEINS